MGWVCCRSRPGGSSAIASCIHDFSLHLSKKHIGSAPDYSSPLFAAFMEILGSTLDLLDSFLSREEITDDPDSKTSP